MKKSIGILLSGLFVLGTVSCSNENSSSSLSSEELSQKSVSVYLNSLDKTTSVNLHFHDKDEQIPYIEMDDAFRIRKALFDSGTTYETPNKSTYEISRDGSQYTVTINKRGTATFDIENQTLTIPNLGLVQAYSYNDTPYDILCMDSSSSSIHYVTHQKNGDSLRAYAYMGNEMVISLKEYSIPVYEKDNKAYIPLDLFNNFFLSYTYNNFVYNGDAIFTFTGLGDPSEEYLNNFYFCSNAKKKRSKELAEFSYNSLMLNLNYQYGLKERHSFGDFRKEFKDLGLEDSLKSTDEKEYMSAIFKFIYNAFGDAHCSFQRRSPYSTANIYDEVRASAKSYVNIGYAEFVKSLTENETFRSSAAEANPDYGKCYYEDGDTAYVRFDSFSTLSEVPDYYQNAPTGNETDLFGVIIYANKKIKENSAIKNVVIDMATNRGGEEPSLIFALGWLLGNDTRICLKNPVTNCASTIYYNADVNLDGKYDITNDTLEGYNKFILTSHSSFSCGNAFPCLAKASEKVKIIGQTSAGGACQVFPLITTDGTVFNISGGGVLCTEKNSHYKDIDDGATPDFTITETTNIFDRAYTTKVVHSLVL